MRLIRFKDFLIDYLELNNISNKDFASRIDITQKHLIDILNGDVNLSSKVISNISFVTNIPVDYIYRVEENYKIKKEIQKYLEENKIKETELLNKFNYRYLIKNNYIDFIDPCDKIETIKDIIKFLRVSSPKKIYELNNNVFYKSKNDKKELLLLWLEKCYRETLKQKVGEYKKENIEILVDYIKDNAKKGIFDENKLIEKFNENGIFLVIQDDIPGSKIRGAFKVHRQTPAIYLTHKHKRIADIYFTLLHELAHCKSDFNKAKNKSLVSLEETEEKESKADTTAYNWMVDDKYYNNICKSPNYNIDEEKEFPKSFVVYRLAKDNLLKYNSKKYQKYNFIIK